MNIDPQLITLLMELRRRGVTDTKVLGAFERIPREIFVPEHFAEQAYEDLPFPIQGSYYMLPPYMLANMFVALKLTETTKILEIGTGTGYCAALLAKLVRRVYTIEIDEDLWTLANARFKKLELHKITTKCANGLEGWIRQAPFDRILIHGSLSKIPEILYDQLVEGGLMIFAQGDSDYDQKLVLVEKTAEGQEPQVTRLNAVKFAPLLDVA